MSENTKTKMESLGFATCLYCGSKAISHAEIGWFCKSCEGWGLLAWHSTNEELKAIEDFKLPVGAY